MPSTTPGARPVFVVDTREQWPFPFRPEVGATVRKKLDAGDYSLEGFEAAVAVERKNPDDFVSSAINEASRFWAELRRLATYERAAVVVECGLADITARRYRGGVAPDAVLGAAAAIWLDLGIPVFFAGDRIHARLLTETFLLRFWRNKARG
jgi:ERCC4-type nuclease